MIELLLEAERALSVGFVDQAEQLYWQAIERDPQNAIAVVGLARVALERGDDRTAYEFARKALAIDPENSAGRRLAARLAEVIAFRGEDLPRGSEPTPPVRSEPASEPGSAPEPETAPVPPTPEPAPLRGLLDRLLRRR